MILVMNYVHIPIPPKTCSSVSTPVMQNAKEKFEDIKGVIRSRKSKNRQHDG